MKNRKKAEEIRALKSQPRAQRRRNGIDEVVFVETYLRTRNATEAARAAGSTAKDLSVAGHEILRKPKVSATIKEREHDIREKEQLTTHEVMHNMAVGLRFDPRKLFNPDGTLKPVVNLDTDTAAALTGFEVVEMAGGLSAGEEGAAHVPMFTKKVKWLDKNIVREQAMKHFGLFQKDREQLGNAIGKAIIVPAKDPNSKN